MTTELTLPQRAAVALGAAEHEKKLALLVEESKTITEIKNVDGRTQCHSAMMTLKNARIAIEKTGKAAREDAQAFSKAVIAEEKRLIGITEAEEARLQSLRDKWDADREAERQAKIEAERQRVGAIRALIEAARALPLHAAGKSSEQISQMIFNLSSTPDYAIFEEFADEYKAVRLDVLDQLAKAETRQRGIEIEAESQRQEAARLKAEREELARLRAEAEARRAEEERQAAERRAVEEAALKAERERLAAERAEIERQQAEIAAAKREAEEAEERRIAEITRAEEEEAERARLQAAAAQAETDARNQETGLEEVLHAALPAGLAQAIAPRKSRPDDEEIIEVLALHFRAHESKVIEWLLDMNLEAASERMVAAI